MPIDKKTPPPVPADALARPSASMRDAMPSPFDEDVIASTPKPVTKSPFGGATWMDNAAYPLVKPEHGVELEQNAAVNEFGMKMPRAAAEAEAYAGYKKRQHTEAAAHHLAGMKAAHGAGDMEAARKHSLMYNLHSKAIGHEPVGPAHPDVIAHLGSKPAKVYKFKPHHGDQLALTPSKAPEASGVLSSAPAPALGKNERQALYTVWQACQALSKGDIIKFPGNPKPAEDKGKEADVDSIKQKSLDRGRPFPLKTKKAEGGVMAAKQTVTDKFHGAGKQLGPTVQVDKGTHTNKAPHPRTEPAYRKTELPSVSPRAKGAAPCVCTSYNFPHRHKSGKCGADKK